MTNEQINIAIAEECGIPIFTTTRASDYPDYCADLNAMHEAEKTLSLAQFWEYADTLSRIVCGDKGKDSYISATARQRAEAFLRTLGKWEEASQ